MPTPQTLEHRALGAAEVRARRTEDGAALIEGHAAVFDSNSVQMSDWFVGDFVERVAPGAFAETIAKDDVRALWNHDTAQVLGRNRAGTLSLAEDATGLAISIRPPDTGVGRDAVHLIERGDVTGMSFAFQAIEDEWTIDGEERWVRTLRKVKLYEVSPVTFPAYPATDVSVAKRSLEAFLAAHPRMTPAAEIDWRRRRIR